MIGPFHSDASPKPTVGPGDVPGSIGVSSSPDSSAPVGIASEAGRIGGFDWPEDRDLGPREAVWSLVVEGEPVEGRLVLRAGRFVELAEDVG